MKKFTLLLSLIVPLLTGTAAAQALNLTPFAGSWKGELYQIDQQLKLPIKLTVYKQAVKGGVVARAVISIPGGTCSVDYLVNDVSETTIFATSRTTAGNCFNGDVQFPLSKNAAGKALLGYTVYKNSSGVTLTTPNVNGTMWRY